jgi:hypothetical protein
MAPFGTISTTYPVEYHIHNDSARVEQIMVVQETSDAFMFSGVRQQPRHAHRGSLLTL